MVPQSRIVGLNKHQRPQPLLKHIKGRQAQGLGSAGPKETSSPLEMGRNKEDEDLEFITAPPQSSDDEEESETLGKASMADSSLDSDDDDYMLRRGDIRPTNFSKPSSSYTNNTQISKREGARSSSRYGKATSDVQGESSSFASSKRSADEVQTEMGEHLRDDYGFTRPSKKSKVKRSSTYSSQSKSSQQRASQKSEPRSSASKDNDTSRSRQRFIQHGASLSPEATKTSPKRFLKMREDSVDIEDAPSSSNTFKAPRLGPSPSLSPQASGFKRATLSDDSPEKPKIKLFDLGTETSPMSSQRPLRTTKLRKSRSAGKLRSKMDSPGPMLEEPSQRPTFKMPELDESDIIDSDIQDVVSQHELENEAGNDVDVEEIRITTTARCPMCHEVVDRELLDRHSDNGRMSIKKQTAFCRLHSRKAALNSGSERGYPRIDWGTLDSRCDKHQDFLKKILEGSQSSYFAKVLKEQVQSGKNRTLLKTEDSLTPGYYGPRGLRFMTEYIMRTLSTVVRKRAIEDRLVSARGYTGYVQTVLVPELAVRLIMEDMGVPEKTAREILRDSIEIGELLYEDVGDVIVNMSEEEDM
ncbi:RTC4-like domain-containing protein [Biscogniauxia mediterranea]|nr:RTC4-like domain-containing protein [Biscogniauxia mediterranea]